MKTEARSFRFSTLAIVVLMIATLICGFTVMASAAGTQIEIDESDLRFEGLTKDATDIYTKEYDGKMEVTVSLTDEAKAELPEGVDVTVTAVFNSKDVKDAKNILITPICAHDMGSRCIVASMNRHITVELTRNARRNAFLSVDGGKALKLNMGDVTHICSSDKEIKLIRLMNRSFYDVINTKFRHY